MQAVDPLHVIETVMRYFYSLRASGATKCGTYSNSRTLLFVVYIGAVGVAAGVLLVAIEAFEPNRRLAWVLKVLIMGAAATAVSNRLLYFVA